jgi:predicted tellurium resistance membrane protein TerC
MNLDFGVFAHTQAWVSLVTLTFLEIVLGVDNIIFISLITQRLPPDKRKQGQNIGLALAMVLRIILLFGIGWIMGLQDNLLPTSWGMALSGKGIILIAGGLFLLYKSTTEIHHKLTGEDNEFHIDSKEAKQRGAFVAILMQIALLNIVFSFDSILTAIGIADQISVMIIAVVLSILVMMLFTQPVGRLVAKYPTLQMLALSFLIMIGVTLIMEGFGHEVDKTFVYISVAFSLGVEMLNIRFRKKAVKNTKASTRHAGEAV